LELEPGEKIAGEPHMANSIRLGDLTVRVGSGPDATPLIIIKPRIAGLDTTMVVPTDRRAYYVRLESKPNEYVARVAFSYPEDSKQKWQEYLAKQREAEQQEKAAEERVAELPNTALDNMYWNYEIKAVTYRRALCTSWMTVRRPISKCLSRRFTANYPYW